MICLICVLLIIQSCGNDLVLKKRVVSIVYNQSEHNLVIATYIDTPSASRLFEKIKILKGESIEFSMDLKNRMDILNSPKDSVFIFFEDGKQLVFQRSENSPKNFLQIPKTEIPVKGDFKNTLVDRFYITSLQYKLAK